LYYSQKSSSPFIDRSFDGDGVWQSMAIVHDHDDRIAALEIEALETCEMYVELTRRDERHRAECRKKRENQNQEAAADGAQLAARKALLLSRRCTAVKWIMEEKDEDDRQLSSFTAYLAVHLVDRTIESVLALPVEKQAEEDVDGMTLAITAAAMFVASKYEDVRALDVRQAAEACGFKDVESAVPRILAAEAYMLRAVGYRLCCPTAYSFWCCFRARVCGLRGSELQPDLDVDDPPQALALMAGLALDCMLGQEWAFDTPAPALALASFHVGMRKHPKARTSCGERLSRLTEEFSSYDLKDAVDLGDRAVREAWLASRKPSEQGKQTGRREQGRDDDNTQMSERMSERMPERMSERMPERMSERMPERMSERMSKQMAKQMLEVAATTVRQRTPELQDSSSEEEEESSSSYESSSGEEEEEESSSGEEESDGNSSSYVNSVETTDSSDDPDKYKVPSSACSARTSSSSGSVPNKRKPDTILRRDGSNCSKLSRGEKSE